MIKTRRVMTRELKQLEEVLRDLITDLRTRYDATNRNAYAVEYAGGMATCLRVADRMGLDLASMEALAGFSLRHVDGRSSKIVVGDAVVEELPRANDRRQWRILHAKEGTIVTYVGESITPDRALFCYRCADIGCAHTRIVQQAGETTQ